MVVVPVLWRDVRGEVRWAGGVDDPVVVTGLPDDVAGQVRSHLEQPYELESVTAPEEAFDAIEPVVVQPRQSRGVWTYRLCGLAAQIEGRVVWAEVVGL